METTDFMNYFNHGIDCFIDGSTHILRKIIVHSNTVSSLDQVPLFTDITWCKLGSPLFQRYKRCPWEISDPSLGSQTIRYSDSFETINSYLSQGSDPSPPMVLDRSEDYDALSIQAFSTREHCYNLERVKLTFLRAVRIRRDHFGGFSSRPSH